MKKFLAILLAMMLVMVSVAAVAGSDGTGDNQPPAQNSDVSGGNNGGNSSDGGTTGGTTQQTPTDKKIVDPDSPVAQTTPTTPITITKSYQINGEGSELPKHTITFTQQTKKVGNVKIGDKTVKSTEEVKDSDVPNVTITLKATDFSDAQTTFSNNLTINLPSYDHAGVYDYTFTEDDGGVAGVEYFNDTLYLSVTVIETATAEAPTSSLKIGGVALRRASATGTKIDNIENVYNANTLTVSKTVSGNLGDYTKEWNFTVVLTAPEGDTVFSTIKTTANVTELIPPAEEGGTPTKGTPASTINPGENGWKGSRTFTFTLKHGESLKFSNLPVGVKYTVAEAEAGTNGYTTTGTVATATAITKNSPATVEVTNDKDATIDTGITLETLPYVLMMALAMMGLVTLKLRKREEY